MKKPHEITDQIIKKEFTDREKSRELFWQWYEKAYAHQEDFFVLSYYGIGGIGKSSLINQLCRELTDSSKLYIKYDFESAKGLDPYNIVVGLKQSLRNKYGARFQFPLTNAALLMMAKKSDLNFENDELIKSIVNESPYFGLAVDTFALAPVVGPTIQYAIKFFSQLSADLENRAKSQDLKEKYRRAMEEMKYLEADELQQKIPTYFQIDLAENVRGLSMPLVIILDTYEKYIDTFKASSNVILDNWLWEGTQSLIQRIPGILWIISGRDKLTWDSSGEWDDKHLICLEVKDFFNLDSIKYLQAAGITDNKIITRICKITKGVPVYLSLCVDTYYLIKNQGKDPDVNNFEVNQQKIASCYVKYLDHANRTLIYMLASMGSWLDDEAQYVGKQFLPGIFSAELYDSMIQHSFIKTDEFGKRQMHNIVINGLMSGIKPSSHNEVSAYLFHYRVMKLVDVVSFNDLISIVDDAIDCFCKISDPNVYDNQYDDFRKLTCKITEIGKKGLIYESLRISTKLNEHCKTIFQNTDYYCESLLIRGDSLYSTGKYKQALENDKISYDLRQKHLGENHSDTLESLNNLARDYSRLGRFDDALKADEQVYNARKRILGEDHPDTLSSLNNLARNYSRLGRFDDALKADEQVHDARKRILGEDHPDTLSSLNNLAVDYRRLGRFNDALKADEQVHDARKRILGKEHPDTLSSLKGLAVDYRRLGRFDDALKADEQVHNARKQILGMEHPDTLSSLKSLAVDYRRLGRFEDALKADEQVYDARKRILGVDHPDTLSSLNNLTRDYIRLERFEEALKAYEQVHDARKRIFGMEHPNALNRDSLRKN